MELVEVVKGNATTTSLKVAEVFEKRHDNVLYAIRNLGCSEAFALLNFKECYKINDLANGRREPYFTMTRDGFTFLAMGFTGKKASEFKERYIAAFNDMEKTLLQKQNLSWQQARAEGKVARHMMTDVIAAFVDYAVSQGSQSARMYYQNVSKMVNRALEISKVGSTQPYRDMLNSVELTFLATTELKAREAIIEGMSRGLHYKDIYALAREQVTAFVTVLPRMNLALPSIRSDPK